MFLVSYKKGTTIYTSSLEENLIKSRKEVDCRDTPACFINSFTSWAVKFVAVTPKALAMC